MNTEKAQIRPAQIKQKLKTKGFINYKVHLQRKWPEYKAQICPTQTKLPKTHMLT